MNKYYTKMSKELYDYLFELRGAHNLWYVYTKNLDHIGKIRDALTHNQKQDQTRYDFEAIMDECGYGYFENQLSKNMEIKSNLVSLWRIEFG